MESIPSAIDLETMVLGTALGNESAVISVISSLTKEDFYDARHQHIFGSIADLHKNHDPVNLLSVTQSLRAQKKLEKAGGLSYVSGLYKVMSGSVNLDYYVKIIKQKHIQRKLMALGSELMNEAADEGADGLELLGTTQKRLTGISEIAGSKQESPLTLVKEILKEMELSGEEGNVNSISTGYNGIPNWEDDELIILGADTGMGKTALALGCALHVAVVLKEDVGIINNEMTSKKLMQRMLSILSGVPLHDIKTGKALSSTRFMKAAEQLSEAPIHISTDKGMDAHQVKATFMLWKHKFNIKFGVYDYIQRTKPSYKGQQTKDRVSEISRILKETTLDAKVPIMALSSLGRELKGAVDKKPSKFLLKESGDIEFDADRIYLLWRPAHYGIDSYAKDYAVLLNEKSRQDGQTDIPLKWSGYNVTFTSYENPEQAMQKGMGF